MSFAYRFHPGTRLALLRGDGPFTFAEWERATLSVLEQPAWQGTRRILSDRRRMGGPFPPQMEELVVDFFRRHAAALGEVRWAVVIPLDPEAIGTVRLAAELSKNTRVRVQGFTDIGVALQWILGVHPHDHIAALTRWIDEA